MARGSNSEVETQSVIAKELGFGEVGDIDQAAGLVVEVGKMLSAIMKSL
jgi:four helix bundle protein